MISKLIELVALFTRRFPSVLFVLFTFILYMFVSILILCENSAMLHIYSSKKLKTNDVIKCIEAKLNVCFFVNVIKAFPNVNIDSTN